MKRLAFNFIGMIMGLGTIWAQPTLNSDILLEVGESAPVQYFSQGSGVFDPGPSGANVNWDFSSVTATGDAFSWEVADPATTVWATEFPDADYALSVPRDSGQSYSFYGFDGTDFSLQGNVFVYQDGSDTLRQRFQEDPTLELQVPFSFGDEVSNVSSGQVTLVAGGSTILVDRTITRTIRADAYGSLTTPLGTFNDVLRIRIGEEIVDEVFGFPSGEQTNARYYWYAPSEKYLLLQMDSLVVNTLVGDFPSFVMFYRSGPISTTSLQEALEGAWQFKLYPNPAHDLTIIELELDQPQALICSVYTLQGQLAHQAERIAPAGPLHWPLDLQHMAPGVYVLHLHTAEGSLTRRLQLR